MKPTAEFVRRVLDYDPETGSFTWKTRSDRDKAWNGQYAGTRAGTMTIHGYRQIGFVIDGKYRQQREHRLAWLYVTGEWATEIDHINRIKHDNRFANLRSVTRSQNNKNTRPKKTAAFRGVSFDARPKAGKLRWRARMSVTIECGVFGDQFTAAVASNYNRVYRDPVFAYPDPIPANAWQHD